MLSKKTKKNNHHDQSISKTTIEVLEKKLVKGRDTEPFPLVQSTTKDLNEPFECRELGTARQTGKEKRCRKIASLVVNNSDQDKLLTINAPEPRFCVSNVVA